MEATAIQHDVIDTPKPRAKADVITFGTVPRALLHVVWPDVVKLLTPSIATSGGKHNPEDIKKSIVSGVLVLWIVRSDDLKLIAAVTTRVIQYPQRKALALDWVGGTRMSEWLPIAQPIIENFAKDNKCDHLEGYGRKAWGRWGAKYNWKPEYIAYRMELNE